MFLEIAILRESRLFSIFQHEVYFPFSNRDFEILDRTYSSKLESWYETNPKRTAYAMQIAREKNLIHLLCELKKAKPNNIIQKQRLKLTATAEHKGPNVLQILSHHRELNLFGLNTRA